jgi:hypothetical protein
VSVRSIVMWDSQSSGHLALGTREWDHGLFFKGYGHFWQDQRSRKLEICQDYPRFIWALEKQIWKLNLWLWILIIISVKVFYLFCYDQYEGDSHKCVLLARIPCLEFIITPANGVNGCPYSIRMLLRLRYWFGRHPGYDDGRQSSKYIWASIIRTFFASHFVP